MQTVLLFIYILLKSEACLDLIKILLASGQDGVQRKLIIQFLDALLLQAMLIILVMFMFLKWN